MPTDDGSAFQKRRGEKVDQRNSIEDGLQSIHEWAESLCDHPDLNADIAACAERWKTARSPGTHIDPYLDRAIRILLDRYMPTWMRPAVFGLGVGLRDQRLRTPRAGTHGIAMSLDSAIYDALRQGSWNILVVAELMERVAVVNTWDACVLVEVRHQQEGRHNSVIHLSVPPGRHWQDGGRTPGAGMDATFKVDLGVTKAQWLAAAEATWDTLRLRVDPLDPTTRQRGATKGYKRDMQLYRLWRGHPTQKPNRPDLWAEGALLLTWEAFTELILKTGSVSGWHEDTTPRAVEKATKAAIAWLAPRADRSLTNRLDHDIPLPD